MRPVSLGITVTSSVSSASQVSLTRTSGEFSVSPNVTSVRVSENSSFRFCVGRLLGNLLTAMSEREPRLRPGPEIAIPEEYTMAETNESVLLSDEYSAVRCNGTVYPFVLEERREATLTRYRYTVSRVADTTSAYAQQLRDEHLFRLSGLSEGERSVVNEAIDGVYYAEDTDDESFRSILDQFSAESAIGADRYDGIWLVRCDGEVYTAELSYRGFDQDDRPVTPKQ